MRYLIGTMVLVLTISAVLPAAAADDRTSVSFSTGDYTWKEFNSVREVKESGMLFSLEYAGAKEFGRRFIFRPAVELFGGKAGYQGRTLTGTPADTTVNYYGVGLKGDTGLCFRPANGLRFEPFGGLGMRAWLRDLLDGTSAAGTPVPGYTEGWITLQARFGLRAAVAVSQSFEVLFEGGIKMPLFNETIIKLSEAGGTLRLRPGTRASVFAEFGMTVNRLNVSLFYDSLRFTRSNLISGFFQPRSVMDLYGLKIGWQF